MDAFAPVITLFVGVAIVVLGQWFNRAINGPRLSIEFDRVMPSFILLTSFRDKDGNLDKERACKYVRVKVINSGRESAKNCRGHIVAIEESSDGRYQPVPGGDDTIQLIWSYVHRPDRTRHHSEHCSTVNTEGTITYRSCIVSADSY